MEETSEHEQVKAHRKVIEPLWTNPLVEALADELPIASEHNVLVAEARCGYLPIELRKHVIDGGRVVALDDQRPMLDAARSRAEQALSEDIFFDVESAHSISYADGVFDTALCFEGMVTPRQMHRIVEELARVTVEGGSIAAVLPLSSSFSAFYDLLDETLRRHDLDDRLGRIDDVRQTLASPPQMIDVADQLGLDALSMDRLSWTVGFQRGRAFLNSPLVRETFFPHWIGPVPSHEREMVLSSLGEAIDTYWADRDFRTEIEAGALFARATR